MNNKRLEEMINQMDRNTQARLFELLVDKYNLPIDVNQMVEFMTVIEGEYTIENIETREKTSTYFYRDGNGGISLGEVDNQTGKVVKELFTLKPIEWHPYGYTNDKL